MAISPENILLKFLVMVLLTAILTDLRSMRIPNLLTFSAMGIAVVYHGCTAGLSGIAFSMAGLLTGIALLIIPYAMGGMGGGDVKLMGAVGAVLGSAHALSAFAYIAIIGGLYAIVKLVIHHRGIRKLLNSWKDSLVSIALNRKFIPSRGTTGTQSPKLCYGVAICFGTFLYMWTEYIGFALI